MKPDIVLVDLNQLHAPVDGLELGDTKRNQCLPRWLKYVEWWNSRASQANGKLLSLRSAVVVGGALVPPLVGLREIKVLETYAWLFALASIVVGLVIAICAGLKSLRLLRIGDRKINWRDIVSSTLGPIHAREMIARVILGTQKNVNTESPRAIAGLKRFRCKAVIDDLRRLRWHTLAYAKPALLRVIKEMEKRASHAWE